ncbi:MAG TPA: hypothetical protein VFO07_01815, partial [Roseiflexaceae bacterium]|nr:hypothetical protein [Roseiflexaceae bacterium]
EGAEVDGRGEMERVLQKQLGYNHREASDAIDAMIESGTLRYHAHTDVGGAVPAPVAVGTAGSTPTPTPSPLVVPIGHWQIGGGVVESSDRKGQVTPT